MLEGLIERTRNPDKRAELEAELALPDMPLELEHVWNAFRRLHARRASGFSASPIAWAEIDAFQRLAGLRLGPFEVRLVEDLDDLFLQSKV